MFRSKYWIIGSLVAGSVILLITIFCVYNYQNNKNINVLNKQNEQAYNNKSNQDQSLVPKEEILTPIQKYYKDYLEQDEITFLSNAKSSKNNDLEFRKLEIKFIKATDVLNEKYIENIDPEDAYYKNNWVKIPYVEGNYFYSVNFEYLLKKYGKYLSTAYNEWLKFTLKRESVMQDGGLSVPPDKLREYIIFLEKFTEQNPKFILAEDAKDILKSYLMTYLEGIDNSPIFDKWNTRKMLPEFKASYERFLAENKNSKYYPMVEELYNKAKENNFTWDREFDAWLYKYHEKYFAE